VAPQLQVAKLEARALEQLALKLFHVVGLAAERPDPNQEETSVNQSMTRYTSEFNQHISARIHRLPPQH
jgi:hypothetical protein